MAASLHFDGDRRRVYEVPDGGSFTTDGDGYRIYTPGPSPEADTSFSTTELWSRWVDWHATNKWATLAMSKSGGAFRGLDQNGDEVYATFDLRWTNQWSFVPANYPHRTVIIGNIYPNEDGVDFDTSRVTSQGVSPRIQFADSLQVLRQDDAGGGGGGLSDEQEELLRQAAEGGDGCFHAQDIELVMEEPAEIRVFFEEPPTIQTTVQDTDFAIALLGDPTVSFDETPIIIRAD